MPYYVLTKLKPTVTETELALSISIYAWANWAKFMSQKILLLCL